MATGAAAGSFMHGICIKVLKVKPMDLIHYLFGKAESPDSLQVILRGIITFLTALIIIRVGAKRTFGKGTAVDNIVVIMLGGMLSRVVTGAAAFLPVMTGTIAIVILHRLLSSLSANRTVSGFLTGRAVELYAGGKMNKKNLRITMTSKEDLDEAVRLKLNTTDMTKVEKIIMERNGEISVTEK